MSHDWLQFAQAQKISVYVGQTHTTDYCEIGCRAGEAFGLPDVAIPIFLNPLSEWSRAVFCNKAASRESKANMWLCDFEQKHHPAAPKLLLKLAHLFPALSDEKNNKKRIFCLKKSQSAPLLSKPKLHTFLRFSFQNHKRHWHVL